MLNAQREIEVDLHYRATGAPHKVKISQSGAPIACHECDLLQVEPTLGPGETARCARCGAILLRNPVDSVERTLALIVAAAILWLIVNLNPLVGIEIQGIRTEVTLFGAVHALWADGMRFVATLVFSTVMLFPLLELSMLAILLAHLMYGSSIGSNPVLYRLACLLRPWSMAEVLLLGMLVSLVKLSHLAMVILGPAFWAIVMLVVVLAAALRSFNPALLWRAPPLPTGNGDGTV